MNDALPPKPGHTITFEMPVRLGTTMVNRLITETIDKVILERDLAGFVANREYRRPKKGQPHYVHGFGNDLRDTPIARYTPFTGEVVVHYPPNYWGDDHPTTDDHLRVRVAVWDALLFALGGPKGAGGVTTNLT